MKFSDARKLRKQTKDALRELDARFRRKLVEINQGGAVTQPVHEEREQPESEEHLLPQ